MSSKSYESYTRVGKKGETNKKNTGNIGNIGQYIYRYRFFNPMIYLNYGTTWDENNTQPREMSDLLFFSDTRAYKEDW